MNLLLIHVWNENEIAYRGKFSSFFSYPSITLATVYALIPQGVFDEIDVLDEHSQRVNYDKKHYDLVMLSSETSSSGSAYKHADAFRARGSYVVCGGYHATALPEEALEHCDTVIQGPGELSIPEFIRDFAAGKPQRIYSNYNVKPTDFVTPAREKVTLHGKLKISTMIANPGCNNACKYCSMRTMWKSVCRPIEDVIEEIKHLKSKLVIFYDPNFFANREYAIELMKAMTPLKILWASNATADFGYDEELMDIAYKSGCRGVLLGLESLNEQSLYGAAKRFRNVDKYKEIIANIHKHNIAINGCFVLGFDNDTEEELLRLPAQIDDLGLDLCRFAILTPYPGTMQFKEYDDAGRLLTKDWSKYTQHVTVFNPKNFTPDRLNEIYRIVWREAYSWKRVFHRLHISPWRKHWYGIILLGANIGFKYLGIDEGRKNKSQMVK